MSLSPRTIGAAILLLIVAALGCELRDDGETTLVLTGSSTVAPLMTEIAKRFESENPGWRIDVQAGGSSRGIADVRSGLAQIGMISRELAPDEKDLRAWAIARDGVALIVHRSNPVRALDRSQILAIYSGRVRNWREVGGRDAEITVVTKAEGRATRQVFLEYLAPLASAELHADIIIGHNAQAIQTVGGNPHAIGFVSIGAAEVDAERGTPIRLLPIDGRPASLDAVAAGEFPLTRHLNLVTRSEPGPAIEALIRFARSEQLHDLIRAQSFAPLQP